HPTPVGIQLLGHVAWQRRKRPLTHLDAGGNNFDGPVRKQRYPGVGLQLCRKTFRMLDCHRRLRPPESESDRSGRHPRAHEKRSPRNGLDAVAGIDFGHPALTSAAALLMARLMRLYVPQRHRLPSMLATICSSDGSGILASSAAACMICPDWQ